jgi:hypothetical protein
LNSSAAIGLGLRNAWLDEWCVAIAPQIALLVAQSLTAVGKYEEAEAELRRFVKEHADRAEVVTTRRSLQKLEESGKIDVPKQEAMKQ